MKKFLSVLLLVLVSVGLFVSCNPNAVETVFEKAQRNIIPVANIKPVEIVVDQDKLVVGENTVEINIPTLSDTQLTEVANKINTLQKNKTVASFTNTNLEKSINISKQEGLNKVLAALKNEATDTSAKSNIETKQAKDIVLGIKLELSKVDVSSADDLTITYMEFDVTPIASITVKDSTGNDLSVTTEVKKLLEEPITFRLPVDPSVTDKTMAIYHEDEFLGNYEIITEGNEKYVEVESQNFSKFGYQIVNKNNAGAEIGDTLYFKFEDAVARVKNNETITLLKPANPAKDIVINEAITFSVDKNTKEYDDDKIKAGEGFKLTKAGTDKVTYTIVTYTAPNTYTVTFDMQGHGTQISTKTNIVSGSTIEEPPAPTADGYTFGGWYKEAACTTAWNFNTDSVTKNTTLYAKWTAKTYTITYKDLGDNTFSGTHGANYPKSHTYGTATTLVNPTKTGYTFDGWFTTSDCSGTAITSIAATGYTSNITLYAKWLSFKAVYNTNGDANTLTFYYDAVDHSGENITVYNNLPTAATNPNAWDYNSIRGSVKSVVIDSSVADYHSLTSTAYMFQKMQKAENISGTENLDTSKVTSMAGMFFSCKVLSSLDVSGFDTSIVTDMQSMFNNCNELSSLDLSSFKTSIVTNMQSMFLNCKKLTALDISSFNTSEVGNMNGMFKDCSALAKITFGNSFDTSKVTNMGDMFRNCSNLISVKTTENVKIKEQLGNGWTYDDGAYARWGVTGSIASKGFNWDKDVGMTETGNGTKVFESPAITLTTSDQFKVRLGGAWTTNYGAPGENEPYEIASGISIEATTNGKNIKVPADGDYIIKLDLNNNEITVTVASK